MKRYLLFLPFVLVFFGNNAFSQDTLKLWQGKEEIPFYKQNNLVEYEKETWGTVCVYNVTQPELTIYKATGENSGKAVVIFPGGGYSLVALYHEGHDLAKVLSGNGITAAVLKYRLPSLKSSNMPHLVPITDARRALKLMHQYSIEFGIDTNAIGVVGFSAGSHLAIVAGLWESEDLEENPDFSALIYGVSRLNDENQKWLEESLYYRKLSEKEKAQNRLLELVSADTPPAFLVHSYDDDICHIKESTLYAQKLFENQVPVEMHLFPKGGHGFGMGRIEDGTAQWVNLFINWVKRSEF